MSIELDIVCDVSARLDRAGIAYMLTGSMAMNAYAEPRMTRDVDVVIEVQTSDTSRLISAFSPEYYIDAGSVARALVNEGIFNAIHQEWVFKVDCIVRKSAPFRVTEFARRQRLKIADGETWIVSKEDLILSKLSWGFASRSEYQARDIRTPCDRLQPRIRGKMGSRTRCARLSSRPRTMTDTDLQVAAKYRAMLMAKTPAERFEMGLRMCEAVRATVIASLPQQTAEERKIALLHRYYAGDFSAAELPAIKFALHSENRSSTKSEMSS